MKTKSFAFYSISAIFLVAVFGGCGKKESAPTTSLLGQKTSPPVSAEKTSFNEVTAQLDPGGDFYLYLGTAPWLNGISSKISAYQNIFTAIPNLKNDQREKISQAFDLVTHLVKDSGVEDVSGVGMSSIALEKGLYRNKTLIHHYPGNGSGFLWNVAGKEPHPLTGLDFLPANTAFATFSDLDLPLLWSVAQKESAQMPQAQDWLQNLPAKFEKKTQINWNKFLASLGGEFGLVVTFDESQKIPIPTHSGERLEIPEPALLIVVKVNDDTIFNRIDEVLKKNPQVVSTDRAGLKMRTMPLPIPLPIQLHPAFAAGGGYLFIASSDTIINEALAVKNGQKAGLKSTDEFKHLSQGIPDMGNQFTFMSQRFGETMLQIQKQALATNAKMPNQWMQLLMRPTQTAFSYTVAGNTKEGWMAVANSSQSSAKMVLLPAVAMSGMLAAIAIPNFVKARATSQQNACINNLRQIDGAKQEWALENRKKQSDVPTWNDLKPYLRGPVPLHCPAGGTYTINAVDEPPQCSIPGHRLP